MRRKELAVSTKEALEILDQCEYITVATTNPDGTPYCVPVSVVRKDSALYFHCALVGHKVDNFKHNNYVCVSGVSTVAVPTAAVFTISYTSVIGKGTISLIEEETEKEEALLLLTKRHRPDNLDGFSEYLKPRMKMTAVYKITLDEVSGKVKVFDEHGKPKIVKNK